VVVAGRKVGLLGAEPAIGRPAALAVAAGADQDEVARDALVGDRIDHDAGHAADLRRAVGLRWRRLAALVRRLAGVDEVVELVIAHERELPVGQLEAHHAVGVAGHEVAVAHLLAIAVDLELVEDVVAKTVGQIEDAVGIAHQRAEAGGVGGTALEEEREGRRSERTLEERASGQHRRRA
jgi:hypothetical protein